MLLMPPGLPNDEQNRHVFRGRIVPQEVVMTVRQVAFDPHWKLKCPKVDRVYPLKVTVTQKEQSQLT